MKNANQTQNGLKQTHIDPNQEDGFRHAKINWVPAVFLLLTPLLALILVPWYGLTHGFSTGAWVTCGLFYAWSGMGITAGYHRLWAHKTYKASLPVRLFLLTGATLAVQSSAFDWCSGHRNHHRYVDDVYKDPYSAKRGFWFSHFGWMLKNYPSSTHDFKNIPDLTADPFLSAQHRFYVLWIVLTNVGLSLLIGYLIGDIWGTLILAGLLRLVLNHHATFFINSLAHIWGSQPYTDENTAKDNAILSLVTWGEGYHNYHHIFQYDYRNGVKWWQFDPTKWLIFGLYKLGLTSDLKRVPKLNIIQAEVAMKFKYTQKRLAVYGLDMTEDLQQFKTQVQREFDAFSQTLEEWKKVKEQAVELKIAMKKDQLNQRKDLLSKKLQDVDTKFNLEFKRIEIKMKSHRKQLELLAHHFKASFVKVS